MNSIWQSAVTVSNSSRAEAILAHIDENALERPAELAPGAGVRAEGPREGDGLGTVHERNRLALPPHGPEADLAPGDGRRGLDLDRGGGAPRGAPPGQAPRGGPRPPRTSGQGGGTGLPPGRG